MSCMLKVKHAVNLNGNCEGTKVFILWLFCMSY